MSDKQDKSVAAKPASDDNNEAAKPVVEVKKEQNQNPKANQGNQGKKKGKNKRGMGVKIVKGMADWQPVQMALRERIFETIRSVFRRHGAVTIQTPIAELKTTLTGKYGEDTKLIYDLADQGGEISALRYDLTVPFARYVASHGVVSIKRYQIGRVYRRDQPSKGRYREFFQCDFDIAGVYNPMIPDAECLVVLMEALDKLGLDQFVLKVNHRKLLDAMFQACGVAADDFTVVCSSVDKLDKLSFAQVKEELVTTKGQSVTVIDELLGLVRAARQIKDPREMLTQLREGELFEKARQNDACKESFDAAVADLSLLVDYIEAYGRLDDRFRLDLSLARGLDYYTGIICEAVYVGNKKSIGSIAGGGRYDNLVGMFAGKQVPSIGFSLGVERIFTILEDRERAAKVQRRAEHTQVYVASIPEGKDGFITERMAICAELWKEGVAAELLAETSPKLQKQLKKAGGAPLAVVFGLTEKEKGEVNLKFMQIKKGDLKGVKRDELVQTVVATLAGLADGSITADEPKEEQK